MKDRRELISGFLAALISITIIGGGLAISFAEGKSKATRELSSIDSPTATNTSTEIISTPVPGAPTLEPSATMPTSTHFIPSPTPSCKFPLDWIAITVSQGDTLEKLAKTYQTSKDALMEANCLFLPSISPGSILYVPEPSVPLTPTPTTTSRPTATRCASPPNGWVMYTVQPGDTLYSLSIAYGITVAEFQASNCMGSSTLILTGELLWVPNTPIITPPPSLTPTPSFTPSSTTQATATPRPTRRATKTPYLFPTSTSTATSTATATATSTATPTPTETGASTSTPTPTNTSTFTPSPTATPTEIINPYP